MFNQVKDAIICFDDFERMSNKLDIKDVMGLANQLKLEKNCQVILILDESKNEDENKTKYADYKEKLIDETIKITSVEPLIRANTTDLDEPLVDLMVKFADELEIHNFRFFQKVIKLYKQFREQLPETVANSTKEIILVRILQGYFIEDFGTACGVSWNDFTLKKAVRRRLEKQQKGSELVEKEVFKKLEQVSSQFIYSEDIWFIQFQQWFTQRNNVDYDTLKALAQSELISEENQSLKNKIWDIFHRRFNLKVIKKDFEFLSTIGKQMISIETIYNTSVTYEFIKKYLEDEQKSEKFRKDVLMVIDSDIGHVISRKKEELRLWGYPNNIFYEYIDKLAENYQEEKNLKEIVSHYLQNDYFEDDDKQKLKDFSLEDWYLYLTRDIYKEQFFIDKDKTIVAYLNKLVSIKTEDFDLKNIIIDVLNKIGNESEFKRRYMQDIIENHLD